MTVYGYCRLSVDRSASISIEAQRRLIEDYYDRRLNDAGELKILVDRGVSGAMPLFRRPAGRELAGMRAGDHLVVAKLDRAFRSLIDGATVIAQLTADGIGVHCLDVDVDTTTPMGRAMLHMVLAFAELERDRISERRRDAARERRAQKIPTMAPRLAPLGWQIIDVDGRRQFQPRPKERRQCRRLLELREAGMTYDQIVDHCRRYRWTNRDGRPWNRSRVRRAIVAAREGFPIVSEDSRRWGGASDSPRWVRRRRRPATRNRH